MTGALAEAYYGIPEDLKAAAKGYLPGDMITIVNKFESRYGK